MPERKAFVLRISDDLWQDLQRLAAQELRSVNAQIEYLLRESLAKRRRRTRGPDAEAEDAEEDGRILTRR